MAVRPSPFDPNPPGPGDASTGLEAFLAERVEWFAFYGSGKAALRDGLAPLTERGQAVVLPAYIPDAVVEPFREIGLEVRFHAVRPSLAPDVEDLRSRVGGDVAAILSVSYFGFPSPGFDGTATLTEEIGCLHVDDSAHGAFSESNGTLLGARGDLGITSLWKVLPVPNGALLYLNDPTVAHQFERTELTGTSEHFAPADLWFLLETLANGTPGRSNLLQRTVGTRRSVPGPRDRYEASKRRLSRLTRHIVELADPLSIRRRRRSNYRHWCRALSSRSDLTVLTGRLEPGVCPHVLPVRASRPGRFQRELAAAGFDDVHTWPRLPAVVRATPAYDCARELADSVVVLPVDQHLEPDTIDRIGAHLTS